MKKFVLFSLFSLYPLTLIAIKRLFIQSDIYYKAPLFDVKNANVTFGVVRPSKLSEFGQSSGERFSETLPSICQAELINKKKAQVSIEGIINLVFQDFIDQRSSGQDAILSLLSNNLFFNENNTRVNQRYAVNLTGLFSVSSFGTARINSLITNNFGLPFVAAGDFGRTSADNQFSGGFPAENTTFAQVINTIEFNSFNAILAILNHFNWTLVANLFQANTFGFNRQQNVLDYSAQNSLPIFTCGFVYGIPQITENGGTDIIDRFCRCVDLKSTINVIVLWMTTGAAYSAVESLKEKCSSAKKWTFIVADDFQSPVNYSADKSVLNNSLLLRNNGPWDFEAFLQNCQENSSPETKKLIISLIKDFYLSVFKCQYFVEGEEEISTCSENIDKRTSACSCTLNEISEDPYITKFFYTADSINVYAAAISLIQNNCSFLNDKRELSRLPRALPDFCSLTQFGPLELSFAMRFVNFTGYTGIINFSEEILIRNTKSYYLHSVFNNSFDAKLVGFINITGTTIYNNLISFVNDEIPVSEIVPQNPDLSYAVVCVFFGIAILEVVVCLILLVFLIYYRNNRCIRQTAFLITLTMLFGVIGLALAQIFLSFASTDAWCTINIYLFRISMNLVLMSLLVKNYRIYKIFTNKKAAAVSLSESRLLIYIGLSVVFYVIFLTVFVVALGFEAVLKKSSTNMFYQYIQCVIPNQTWNYIFKISLEIFLILQVFASLILAWLTRNVQTEYRESRRLFAISTIIFVALIIFVPLSYTLDDSTDSQILRYVINVEFLTVTIISVLALLFVPIVFAAFADKRKRQHNSLTTSFIGDNRNSSL